MFILTAWMVFLAFMQAYTLYEYHTLHYPLTNWKVKLLGSAAWLTNLYFAWAIRDSSLRREEIKPPLRLNDDTAIG